MDTGKIKDNYNYYEGYEGYEEIILSSSNENMETLHIWEGYFYNIFGKPPMHGLGWKGFTRDYQQSEGAFGLIGVGEIYDLQEYIDDLLFYKDRKFDEETREVYNLICSWLSEALETKSKVIVVDD